MINQALRLLRVFHDLKAFELADKLEISQSYLSEIESGKKKPSLELLEKYASVFHTPPSSILFFSEDLEQVGKKKKIKDIFRRKTLDFLQKIENENTATIPT